MRFLALIVASALTGLAAGTAVTAGGSAPPAAPARVIVDGSRLAIVYDDATIFEGTIANPETLRAVVPSVSRRGDVVNQVVALFASRGQVALSGTVTGSVEAFPCQSDRPLRALPVVRHSSGPSRSRLNQAVYDRRWDWVLSVDDQPRTADAPSRRAPRPPAAGPSRSRPAASEIVLRFRPRFYQQHRGLRYFEPWTYAAWAEARRRVVQLVRVLRQGHRAATSDDGGRAVGDAARRTATSTSRSTTGISAAPGCRSCG